MSGAQTHEQLRLPGALADATGEWIFAEDEWEEQVMEQPPAHVTVMKHEVVQALHEGAAHLAAPILVDCTLGFGGHSEALLEAMPHATVIGFDRDPLAREASAKRLARFAERMVIIDAPFAELSEQLHARGIEAVHGVCADLGVSSPQLDDPARGMSFRREGPIDMRMDPSQGETALELIARLSDDELANVLYEFGEERRSRRIARKIKQAWAEGQLHTTLDLRRAIVAAVGPVRVGSVDPATRSFQALRIAVNGELSQLSALLAALPSLLVAGAHAALLSFHSLEDRIVKHAFKDSVSWQALSKKPLLPSEEEERDNPRARSAKLRVARRKEAT